MIFVDTSALFALFVDKDACNAQARLWLEANSIPLVTTDYVDEVLTLLQARVNRYMAMSAGEDLLSGTLLKVEFITRVDFAQAWQLFRTYSDKHWSFTDCTSRVVMERLGITTAFAFDEHFHQFANVSVVP